MEMDLTKVSKKDLLNKCDTLTEQLAAYEAVFRKISKLFGFSESVGAKCDINERFNILPEMVQSIYCRIHNYLVLNCNDYEPHDGPFAEIIDELTVLSDERKKEHDALKQNIKGLYQIMCDNLVRDDDDVHLIEDFRTMLKHKAAELRKCEDAFFELNSENDTLKNELAEAKTELLERRSLNTVDTEYRTKVNTTAVNCAKALLELVQNNYNFESEE